MKNLLGLGLLILASLSAAPVRAAWWQPVLVCDGGSAVIEIDLGERRAVKFKISNRDITNYFGSRESIRGVLKFQGDEMSVGGFMDRGVFHASQFRGFQINTSMAPAVQVYREGEGLIVRVVSLAYEECLDYRANDYYCAESRPVPEREIVNWNFRSCEERSVNP